MKRIQLILLLMAVVLAIPAMQANARSPMVSSDGGSSSIEDLYAIVVGNIIKNNWRFPQMETHGKLTTQVSIALATNGSIANLKILKSSGRPDFDASVLRAVADTKQLPKPPNADCTLIHVIFNNHE